MRKEFKIYLKSNGLPDKYFGYCRTIEKAFDGMDIDDIILSHKNITNVRKKLQTITTSKGSISCYITALNHYLNFAFLLQNQLHFPLQRVIRYHSIMFRVPRMSH